MNTRQGIRRISFIGSMGKKPAGGKQGMSKA